MTPRFKKRLQHVSLVGALMFGQSGCGIIMHPERSNASRGHLDGVAIVLDCCWFLAGVVPGIVALGIDFGTGGAWHSAGVFSSDTAETVELRIAGRAPDTCELALRLVDAAGRDLKPATRLQVVEGERVSGLRIALPASLPSDATMVLAIDGREQGRWRVSESLRRDGSGQ